MIPRVLSFLNTDDHLVLDLTHGFRIVPIVLSAAVGYLQVSKNVQLDAVLYGADQSGGQIVDFKGFYRVKSPISNWATWIAAANSQQPPSHQCCYPGF